MEKNPGWQVADEFKYFSAWLRPDFGTYLKLEYLRTL